VGEHKGRIDLELGKAFETDSFDVITLKNEADERTLCGRVEVSPRGVPEWDWGPFYPGGTVQAKVIDATSAGHMAFWGQVGHHGSDFIADVFLTKHPQYGWMRELLKDMKSGPWTRFETGMK
jgi:hypothetical protein